MPLNCTLTKWLKWSQKGPFLSHARTQMGHRLSLGGPTLASRPTQLLRRGGSAPPTGRRVLQSEPYDRHPSVQLCPALSSSVQPLRAPTTRAGAAWRTPSLAGGHPALPISIVSLAAAGPCPLFYHSLPTVKASRDPVHVEGTTPSSPSVTSGGSRDAPPRWTPPAGPQQRAEGLLSRLLSRRLLSRSYLLCP